MAAYDTAQHRWKRTVAALWQVHALESHGCGYDVSSGH